MLKNYFKIALRALWKSKELSFINIAGLSVGMACSMLIFLFVKDELSYDRYHADAGNIYRVVKDFINDDGTRIPDATTQPPLAPAMQREIPEVVTIARVNPAWGRSRAVRYKESESMEGGIWRVDSSFFSVFTVPFLKGDRKTALNDRNSVVMTETTAKRFFGNDDPIGKSISFVGNTDNLTITAVVADPPAQSHMHYDFLMSWHRLPKSVENSWGSYNYYTYVKVRPGTDMKAFEKKIQNIYDNNAKDKFSIYYTQPLTDIHLKSHLKWELEQNGDRMYVYIFSIIGIFILLIASINYINLATAKSSLRAKETGIRKVSGAKRSSLVFQFLLESVILCVIAAAFAVAIGYTTAPTINYLTQKHLDIFASTSTVLYLFVAGISVGILAGIFPALYLSSFKPANAVKGLQADLTTLGLRKTLVVVQFAISTALIISTIIISQQMDYLHAAKLGFDKDQTIVVNNGDYLRRPEANAFLNTLRQIPGVEAAASSADFIGSGFNTTRMRARGSQQSQQLNYALVNDGYLELSGVEFKEGRGFSADVPRDTMSDGILKGPLDQVIGGIVLNERALKEFALDSPAVGKQLVWTTDGDTTYYVNIIGIVRDFHFTSLRNEIKPFGFIWVPRNQSRFSVKIEPGKTTDVLKRIESAWKASFRDVPFQYVFLDQTFSGMYTAETRFQTLFLILAVLGVIIACLGLFALAAFAANQRLKEIGIRKVLGASVGHLVGLLSKDFLKLVVLSILFAVPAAWYAMQSWLTGFAYHISVQAWVVVTGVLITVLIALVTTSFQAFKAAMSNPVESLRSE